jgi:hypothetical protein
MEANYEQVPKLPVSCDSGERYSNLLSRSRSRNVRAFRANNTMAQDPGIMDKIGLYNREIGHTNEDLLKIRKSGQGAQPPEKGQYREWDTWYEFKDELESKAGFYIPVFIWLQIRPQKPLPWNDADFDRLVARVANSKPQLAPSSRQ